MRPTPALCPPSPPKSAVQSYVHEGIEALLLSKPLKVTDIGDQAIWKRRPLAFARLRIAVVAILLLKSNVLKHEDPLFWRDEQRL